MYPVRREFFFTVPVKPVGKARHRTARLKSGKTVSYIDLNTRGDIETFVTYARPSAPAAPLDCAIELNVLVCISIPVSWPKKKILQAMSGELMPTKKPDFDNYLKFASDCLNGLYWIDDCQVIKSTSLKIYSDFPRWEIKIKEITCLADLE